MRIIGEDEVDVLIFGYGIVDGIGVFEVVGVV